MKGRHPGRALPRDDQTLFDQLFAFARKRIAATAMAADPLPMQTLLLSMLIGLFHLLAQMHARLERLEKAAPPANEPRPVLPARLDP